MALRNAVQRFCDAEYPSVQRGNAETPATSARRWQAMAELGLLGLPFDTASGGSAQGPVEVMLVAQEFGRALGGGAFVPSTVMAGHLLTLLGDSAQKQRWLPSMANGTLQAALALYDEGTRYDWQRVTTNARSHVQGWLVNGTKTLVMHGDSAGLLLVLTRTEGTESDRDGLTVMAVDADTPGVHIHSYDTLDGRRAANITFSDVIVEADRVLGRPGQAADAVEIATDAGIAALCAEAAGAVEALLVLTTEHLRTRKQFGAPLARFQVLQHRVADMVIALEQLKSMACAAAMALDATDSTQRRRIVSVAKVMASQQGRQIALWSIQMHGAMGMTDECRVSHYAKRLLVIALSLGDAAHHLRLLTAMSPH